MTWRRFELGGLLGSFFEVRADGADLRVKIGSGGRNAREQVRKQASAEAAQAELERLVAAHVAKGYVEVQPLARSALEIAATAATRAAERERLEREQAEHAAREAEAQRQAELQRLRGVVRISANPELEAQCEASPDDPMPWSVYADWLAEQGDPRGLVAAHELRGDARGAAALLALHREALCGTDLPFEVTFRHGFARAITIGNPVSRSIYALGPRAHDNREQRSPSPEYPEDIALADLVATILDAPIGRFVDEVRTGLATYGGENDWGPTLAAIARSRRGPHVRVVRLDNFGYDDYMLHYVEVGDLSPVRDLPRLEALHVRGEPTAWRDLALPQLRRLVRETCRLTRDELAQIYAMPWPELAHLDLWFGSREYGVDVELGDLAPILDGRAFPRLGHLGIVNCDLLEELIPVLARSHLLPRLYSLDLSMGTLAVAGVEQLVAHAQHFRHLAAIELADNYLDRDDAERLTAVLDNVVVGAQRVLDDDEEAQRYVAEYE